MIIGPGAKKNLAMPLYTRKMYFRIIQLSSFSEAARDLTIARFCPNPAKHTHDHWAYGSRNLLFATSMLFGTTHLN